MAKAQECYVDDYEDNGCAESEEELEYDDYDDDVSSEEEGYEDVDS